MFSNKFDNTLYSVSGELSRRGVFKLKCFYSLQVSEFQNQPGVVLLQCPVIILAMLRSCFLPCCSSTYTPLFFFGSFKVTFFLFQFILYLVQILCSVHIQIFLHFLSILGSLQSLFCILWFQADHFSRFCL